MNNIAKRLLCLVNSRSGGNKGNLIAKQLITLKISGIDQIDVKVLDQIDSLPSFELIEKEYFAVLIAGGDGTFSSILSHYSGIKIDFILLPLGTGNDLAIELGIKKLWKGDLDSFLRQSLDLPIQPVQVWQAMFSSNTDSAKKVKFVNYISFGWDGLVIKKFDQLRKSGSPLAGKFGPWGNRILYIYSALSQIRYHLPNPKVESDSRKLELTSKIRALVFSNICSATGLGKTNCSSNCSDSLIEMCTTNGILDYFKMLVPSLLANPIQANNFTIKFEDADKEIPVQVDGEYFDQPPCGSVEISCSGTVLVRFSKS